MMRHFDMKRYPRKRGKRFIHYFGGRLFEGGYYSSKYGIRKNLLATKFFLLPALVTTLMGITFIITPGPIHWSIFHRLHEKDMAIEFHVKSYIQEIINSLSPCSFCIRFDNYYIHSPIFSGR